MDWGHCGYKALPILASVYVVGRKAGVVSTAATVLQRKMTASVIAANASMCNIDIKSESQPRKETVADRWNKNMLDLTQESTAFPETFLCLTLIWCQIIENSLDADK